MREVFPAPGGVTGAGQDGLSCSGGASCPPWFDSNRGMSHIRDANRDAPEPRRDATRLNPPIPRFGCALRAGDGLRNRQRRDTNRHTSRSPDADSGCRDRRSAVCSTSWTGARECSEVSRRLSNGSAVQTRAFAPWPCSARPFPQGSFELKPPRHSCAAVSFGMTEGLSQCDWQGHTLKSRGSSVWVI